MYRSNGICVGLIAWIYLTTLGDVVLGQSFGSNAVALLNGQASLDCMYASLATSQWSQTPDGTSNNLLIAAGCSVSGSNAAYYRTVQPGGNICRLIIANVTMQQGGVYTCWDGIGVSYRSLVTVIDPHARVEVYNQSEVVDNDQLNISCSINYNGPSSPAPSLRPSPYWTTSPGQIFTSAIYHPSTTLATLVATVRVQKPTVPIFHCYTAFEITGNSSIYNLTAPADNFAVGNSTQMDVEYVPSVPIITSRPEVITINGLSCGISVLTCSSTGNPQPNYTWSDLAENVILSTNNTLDLAEVNRNYKCEAYNTIRNVNKSMSSNYTVSTNNCASYATCCVYPRNETTNITVHGCNETLCDCSKGKGGINLTCNATTYPEAMYKWTGLDGNEINSPINGQVTAYANGTFICIAYFNRTSSNYSGSVSFSYGTDDKHLGKCSAIPTTIQTTVVTTSPVVTTSIGTNVTQTTKTPHRKSKKTERWYIIIIVIGILGLNSLMIGLFIYLYNKPTNRIKLNRRFPWLQEMLPCFNSTTCTGANSPWILLFTIVGILTGIVTVPILIGLAFSSEANNEATALNKRGNGKENVSTTNGRGLPTNIPDNRTTNQRQEDPYQSFELNSSHQSINRLLPDSPTLKTASSGKPLPPPNKPTANRNSRSKDYTVPESSNGIPDHTILYSDLPYIQHKMNPAPTPVQFLDLAEDHYAVLSRV